MIHNQNEAVSRQSAKPQAGHSKVIARIRAALEKETRINLHRFPISLAFAGEDLMLTGELQDVAAKNSPSNWLPRSRREWALSIG